MARNISKMSRSPKAKKMNVAFWNKSDVKAAAEAVKRKKEGKHSNKSTQDFIDKLEKSGDW